MKEFLKRLVKNSKLLYKIYFYVLSLGLKVIGIFVPTDENLILFVVYGGKRYDDSPRFVYEYMKQNPAYKKYCYKWAFIDPESILEVPQKEKIKIDTWQYFITALKAKYWISNSTCSRGLNFKKKNTINIMFQHGMAGIKKIGNDLEEKNQSFKIGYKENFDYIFIEGKKERKILTEAWNEPENVFIESGLPRNDELINISDEKVTELKKKFDIPLEKKVILYAPTFREFKIDASLENCLTSPFDLDMWNKKLGEKYVMLFTAHYEVAKLMNMPEKHPFVINAFQYPHINDLMLVSDILISDYSSIIWDYSLLGKPIISYAYDYKEYKEKRGLYSGYAQIFSNGIITDQKDVINLIQNMDYEMECKYTIENIRNKYVIDYGNAAKRCTEIIFR